MMTIYDLKEHESMIVQVELKRQDNDPDHAPLYPMVFQVTRVATGWIYQNANPNIEHHEGYFVPLTYYTNPTI